MVIPFNLLKNALQMGKIMQDISGILIDNRFIMKFSSFIHSLDKI